MSNKVSVIVSFYNAENLLQRSLSSILNQTYTDLEVILIDDGSTDDGARICRHYAHVDERVHLISKANSGVSSSRNVGLERATGEWVYFADADDWLAPWAIQALVDSADAYASDMAVADFYRVRGSLIARKAGPMPGVYSREEYARAMSERPANFYFCSLWNKLFRRSILIDNEIRFDTESSFGEDHVFILDYTRLISSACIISRPVYYYVDNAGSLMHQSLNPLGVVKMKWRIFRPYAALLKDLGLNRTAAEIARIYRFVFFPATDGFVLPNSDRLDDAVIPG